MGQKTEYRRTTKTLKTGEVKSWIFPVTESGGKRSKNFAISRHDDTVKDLFTGQALLKSTYPGSKSGTRRASSAFEMIPMDETLINRLQNLTPALSLSPKTVVIPTDADTFYMDGEVIGITDLQKGTLINSKKKKTMTAEELLGHYIAGHFHECNHYSQGSVLEEKKEAHELFGNRGAHLQNTIEDGRVDRGGLRERIGTLLHKRVIRFNKLYSDHAWRNYDRSEKSELNELWCHMYDYCTTYSLQRSISREKVDEVFREIKPYLDYCFTEGLGKDKKGYALATVKKIWPILSKHFPGFGSKPLPFPFKGDHSKLPKGGGSPSSSPSIPDLNHGETTTDKSGKGSDDSKKDDQKNDGKEGKSDAAGKDGKGDAAGKDGKGDAAGKDGKGDAAGKDGKGDAAGKDGKGDAAGKDGKGDAGKKTGEKNGSAGGKATGKGEFSHSDSKFGLSDLTIDDEDKKDLIKFESLKHKDKKIKTKSRNELKLIEETGKDLGVQVFSAKPNSEYYEQYREDAREMSVISRNISKLLQRGTGTEIIRNQDQGKLKLRGGGIHARIRAGSKGIKTLVKEGKENPEIDMFILVDLSGSMSGDLAISSQKAVISFLEAVHNDSFGADKKIKTDIRTSVMGFTDNSARIAPSLKRNNATHSVFKQFNEELTPTVKARVGGIADHVQGQNYDMAAILHSKELIEDLGRKNSKKLLVVLSDGLPNGYTDIWREVKAHASKKYSFKTNTANGITREAINLTRKSGIETMCLRLEESTDKDSVAHARAQVESIYGTKYGIVTPTKKIPKHLGKLLRRMLFKN